MIVKKPVFGLLSADDEVMGAKLVVAHAQWKSYRGKRPSMSYRGELNPRKALELALKDLNDSVKRPAYNVVFKTIVGTHNGVITWSSFKNKKFFDEWYDGEMKIWYEVIAEGVSDDQAVSLCSTPEADRAAFIASIKELGQYLTAIEVSASKYA